MKSNLSSSIPNSISARSRMLGLRLGGMLLLAGFLIPLTGCNKMLANLSLSQANKRLAEAKENQADRFAAEALAETESTIRDVQGFINTSQFKEARTLAREAATKAKDLLEQTRVQRANFLKSESNRWIGIMDLNQGKSENPIGYEEVLAKNQKGLESWEGEDWIDAITHFQGAVDDANFLLENLERSARAGLPAIDGMKKSLADEGGEEFYPEGIIELADYYTRVEGLIEEKHDYRRAILLKDEAEQALKVNLLRTKENRSDRLLRQIENLLSDAVNRGAEIYAPRSLESVSRDFESLLKQFYEQKYETVLTTGPDLIPQAESLLEETRRESARAKMKAVEEAIASLSGEQAKVYLPGRVESMEQMLGEASTAFEAEDYDRTEEIALAALDEEKKLILEFDALVESTVADASASLTIAESVFNTMQEIFSQPAPGPFTPEDESIERSKGAMREELSAKLVNARIELGLATLKREQEDFDTAIEISKRVTGESESIVRSTYHVVAHNTVHGLSSRLATLEAEGARRHTPEEMDATETMVQEIRGLIEQGEYRQAVEMAARTKAQMEVLEQALSRVAVAKLDEAAQTLALAKDYRAETYREEQLNEADSLLTTAKTKLDETEVKAAIELAEQATQSATQVAIEALQQWAEEDMRNADDVLARGRQAGADRYARESFTEAEELRRKAEGFYQSGNLAKAQLNAAEAAQTGEKALYAQVIDAENAIAEAKRYGAWTHNSEQLAAAIVEAKSAREYLDASNYAASQQAASQATATAQAIGLQARKTGFSDRLSALQARVDLAQQQGPAYFQVEDLSSIITEMQAINASFQPSGYENATERIELLDARLSQIFESTPNVLQKLVQSMDGRIESLEKRGASAHTPDLVARAQDHIKYAQLDFRDHKFRSSYENTASAIAALNTIELKLDERDYDLKLTDYFTDFGNLLRDYGEVLNMGSEFVTRLIMGPTGRNQALAIVSASSPVEFHQNLIDLGAKVNLMEVPETRRKSHEDTMSMLRLARDGASKFEKLLIIDHYSVDEAREIIETAYLDIQEARSQQRRIQDTLETSLPREDRPRVERIY